MSRPGRAPRQRETCYSKDSVSTEPQGLCVSPVVTLGLAVSEREEPQCRNVLFNRTIVSGLKHTVSVSAWRQRMDRLSCRAAVPKAAGSSLSVTSEPSATASASSPQPRAGSSFPKAARLLKTPEFKRVYDRGRKISGPFFMVICATRPDTAPARIGFTVPRRLGNSVVRNRIRRRMREAVRMELAPLAAGRDLVFHPRSAVLAAPFTELRREVERVFRICGTW